MSEEKKEGQKKAPPAKAANNPLYEFGPLLVFFAANAWKGIYVATGAFMAATLLSLVLLLAGKKKIPPMLWISFLLVGVFGGLTIIFEDDTFIKLKPTIVSGLFAIVLFAGLAMGRPTLKTLLHHAFPPMSERGWTLLTRNWGFFMIGLAVMNELVWRNFSTDTWVSFKVFGILPITFIFTFTQIPVINRYQISGEKNGKAPD